MKPMSDLLEKFRVRRGLLSSDASYGNNGVFVARCPNTKRKLTIIISNKGGWEHASVSVFRRPNDTPRWEEMRYVKNLFWLPGEWVVQYHPAKSEYINVHEGTLHLWRSLDNEMPVPPIEMV